MTEDAATGRGSDRGGHQTWPPAEEHNCAEMTYLLQPRTSYQALVRVATRMAAHHPQSAVACLPPIRVPNKVWLGLGGSADPSEDPGHSMVCGRTDQPISCQAPHLEDLTLDLSINDLEAGDAQVLAGLKDARSLKALTLDLKGNKVNVSHPN